MMPVKFDSLMAKDDLCLDLDLMFQRERIGSDTCFSSSNLHSYSDQYAQNFLEPETFSNDFANVDECMKDTRSYPDVLSDCNKHADTYTAENG
jgi:hypothetical protein